MKSAKVISPDPCKEYFFREGCYILEMWNDPIDPDVSIARARVKPSCTTRVHRLSETTERYTILEGQGKFYSGQQSYEVVAGDVVIIPAELDQSIENTGSCDLVFLAICTPRFSESNYSDAPLTQPVT